MVVRGAGEVQGRGGEAGLGAGGRVVPGGVVALQPLVVTGLPRGRRVTMVRRF